MRTRSFRKACNRPLRTVKLRFRLRSTSQVHLLTPPLFYIALQAAALASCRESHGVCVIIGLIVGVQLNISGHLFFSGRSLKGSVYGGMNDSGKNGNVWDYRGGE